MPDRKYYVRCKTGCLEEALTKEQTLAAILQAVENGEIKDVDTGFITKLKDQNKGTSISIWTGTTAEFNAITQKIDGCLYIITDDTTSKDFETAIEELQEKVNNIVINNPIVPQIVVRTNGGIVTCTDDKGVLISGAENDGVWTFNVSWFGKYKFDFTYNDIKKSEIVDVAAVQQYRIAFSSYSTNFADNSWEEIIEASQLNLVPAEWKAGDGKELATTSGDKYMVRILGKDHDEYEDGTTAPLTFGFIGGIDGVEYNAQMNIFKTNLGGWEQSKMREEIMPLFASQFDSNIQSAIRKVKKVSGEGDGGTGTVTTLDGMFLLSTYECHNEGDTGHSGRMKEGKTYKYFEDGGEHDQQTWLRSAMVGYKEKFWLIDNSSTGGKFSYQDADASINILPAFCF